MYVNVYLTLSLFNVGVKTYGAAICSGLPRYFFSCMHSQYWHVSNGKIPVLY